MNQNEGMSVSDASPMQEDMLLPEVKAKEVEALETDYDKIKQCYPAQVTNIRYMVEDACDRLEYEGSPMFDDIPDAATVQRLAKNVYQQVTTEQDEDLIPCIVWPASSDSGAKGTSMPSRPGCTMAGCIPPYVPDCDRGNCMLRQIIEIMLLNEMAHRRRRYRTRRW